MLYTVAPNCQFGLPILYEQYFGSNNDSGTFVEVGSFDGQNYSNVCGLADIGWKGLCIEPNTYNFVNLKERYVNHKNITCLEIAIGKKPEIELFLQGVISTTSQEQLGVYKSINWFPSNVPSIKVLMKPLDKVLIENRISKEFELLVIDTEGTELEVLETFDILKWLPKMVIVEAHENHNIPELGRYAPQINNYFEAVGYKKVHTDMINNLYVR